MEVLMLLKHGRNNRCQAGIESLSQEAGIELHELVPMLGLKEANEIVFRTVKASNDNDIAFW